MLTHKINKTFYFLSLSVLFAFFSSIVMADNCRPTINPNVANYMIGYGSLINAGSRLRTNPSAHYVYPILLQGFERIWGIHGKHYKTTFLAIIKSKKSQVNAVYYPAQYNDIVATDAREKGYCRIAINRKSIKSLGLSTLEKGQFWVYALDKNKVQKPNLKYPVAQSYVDLFLSGCINVGNAFLIKNYAQQCIKLTSAWPSQYDRGFWVNDRLFPRRPFDTPNAFLIDKLLAKNFKGYYQHPTDH